LVGEPQGGSPTAGAADPPTGEGLTGQAGHHVLHSLGVGAGADWRGRHGRRCHPQHPAPDATAACFADAPQQAASACASAAVPQQVLTCTPAETAPVVAGPPQQPPADAGGFSASAGSPVNPPACMVFVLIPHSFGSDWL
jgi:hypothetical protein